MLHRTTIFLSDELRQLLKGVALRSSKPQSVVVREALEKYLQGQLPRPRSVGMGSDANSSLTSENVKQWVHEQWDKVPR